MFKFLPLWILMCCGYHLSAQTTHTISVAINQGEACPTVTGLEESDLFKIYPNPASNFLNVESELQQAAFQLIDLNGRELRTEEMVGGELLIDLSGLKKGVYILQVSAEGKMDRIKVRIQ
ncbi:MAG: T9SS type A sorting domain-containing protein [Bacteroidota bacterium]